MIHGGDRAAQLALRDARLSMAREALRGKVCPHPRTWVETSEREGYGVQYLVRCRCLICGREWWECRLWPYAPLAQPRIFDGHY